MRVIVCGGRDFSDRDLMFDFLSRLPLTEIASGMARGADTLAVEYAKEKEIKLQEFPAYWNKLGMKAGPDRNERMLTEFKPDAVIAFPGGPGTRDMCRKARFAGYTLQYGGLYLSDRVMNGSFALALKFKDIMMWFKNSADIIPSD